METLNSAISVIASLVFMGVMLAYVVLAIWSLGDHNSTPKQGNTHDDSRP